MKYTGIYDEERALYGVKQAEIVDSKFEGPADGESALKEAREILVKDTLFALRYPLWHVRNGVLENCTMTDTCRAALWYDEGIVVKDSSLFGIKALRECKNVVLDGVKIVSEEFAWRCHGLSVENCTLESVYPFFESKNLAIEKLKMKGKYSFQYVEGAYIYGSVLDTKDAFWHSKNVTVVDSVIRGEYLGWYSENLKLIRCRIIGTQPLCYCKGLILEDCETEGCDLAFERSEVNAKIVGHIDSVKNPLKGKIWAGEIGTLIMEEEYVNPKKTKISVKKGVIDR